MSSPCPAMPTTSVAKMSGAMIDLIIRRNTAERGLIAVANWGAYTPMSTPTTIEIIIHDVSEMRRRPRLIGIVEAGSLLAVYWCGRFDWNRTAAAPKRGIGIAVKDVERETDQQPPSETHPREVRQPAHDEHAKQGAHYSNSVHKLYPEG